MSEVKKLYYKAADGTAEGVVYGDTEGIHDYNLGERLGPEGEPGLPEDKNEPVDLLNDAYDAICIKSAREVRRQADNKCLEAMNRICDAMMVVCARMDELQRLTMRDEGLASFAEEMAALGDSLAKIRTSMESAPMFTGYGV